MRAASGPSAYVNQVMQPVTDYTRASMAHGGVPYAIPGLRQAVVALRDVAWWSGVTRTMEPHPRPPRGRAREASPRQSAPREWSEHAARALLADAGVPLVPARLVSSADEAVKPRPASAAR